MSKVHSIPLSETERIIAVVPEYRSGPGWANSPCWVYIEDTANGRVSAACLQPNEQTPEMRLLFPIGATVCDALKNAVPTKKQKAGGG